MKMKFGGLTTVTCLQIYFLCHNFSTISANPAFTDVQNDVTETSVRNGQTQYEMIRRDSNVPR